MATELESTVFVPDELHAQKAALESGEKPRATVRELLGWFNAARRGNHVVRRVRAALDALGLITWPDFEGEYIDQEVFFMHKRLELAASAASNGRAAATATMIPGPPPGEAPAPVQTTSVGPSHRLGRLKAANRKPISVSPSERLEAASTLMLTHDFSQLPVMQGLALHIGSPELGGCKPSARPAKERWLRVTVLAIAGGLAYLACFIIAFFFASIEEIKQPGGPSKSAVAIWTYLGTCLLIWLLR